MIIIRRLIALSGGLVFLAGYSAFAGEASSSYMVFFAQSSSQLSPGARAIVDQAALAVRGMHPVRVTIAAGTAMDDNLKLADPRLREVRQALIADGVADRLIFVSAIAQASLIVGDTGDQRVEITLVAKTAS